MKVVVSETQKPPANALYGGFYGDNWERGKDPWHRDAFPDGLKHGAPNQLNPRKSGWYLLDAWGNQIGFVEDGTVFGTEKEYETVLDVRVVEEE